MKRELVQNIKNQNYFNKLFSVVGYDYFGIHKFGQLHEIADVMGWDDVNNGVYLHKLWARVCYYTRKLIKAGYPIKESSIVCCSWSERETRHPMFRIVEDGDNENGTDNA